MMPMLRTLFRSVSTSCATSVVLAYVFRVGPGSEIIGQAL